MPQFLFAVGFALRMTLGRRRHTQGSAAAYWRMVRRLLGLILVSLIVYQVKAPAPTWEQLEELGLWRAIRDPLKRDWFQTLMHIAVTTLWILPVIHCRAAARIVWMCFSGSLHIGLSYWFNFLWVNSPPTGIDGGPCGFLTWCIPALLGSFACDVFVNWQTSPRPIAAKLATTSVMGGLLMLFGYGLSCGTRLYDIPAEEVQLSSASRLALDPVWPTRTRVHEKLHNASLSDWLAEPPFVKSPDYHQRQWNYWMMSQRAGTLSYVTFATGFSLLVYLIFFVVCDLWKLQLPFFRTLGTNALLGYVLHELVSDAVQPFVPKDSPAWYAYGSLGVFVLVTWLILRSCEKQGLFLRV